MGNKKLYQILLQPITKSSSSVVIFWFSLSLTGAAIFSFLGLREAFSSAYVVQDDARYHVFWMQRFVDSALFSQDLIADYHQSIAPAGYSVFYRFFAVIGIDPYLLNKLLPGILGLIATAYCFGISLQLFPFPITGFITTWLLNQNLWLQDDLVSGTPVAFVYPFFLAFLYYFLRRSLVGMGIAIALLGLFYPQYVFICVALLILNVLHWESFLPRFSLNRRNYLLSITGLVIAFFILLPYALKSSSFNPIITPEEAKTTWSGFFSDNQFEFWFCSSRSGIFPPEWCHLSVKPLQIFISPLLLIFLLFSQKFTLVNKINKNIKILPQLLLASLSLFFLAHLLLFRIHVPNRYTEHNFRIIFALAAGITLTIILDALISWIKQSQFVKFSSPLAIGITIIWGILIILYPSFFHEFPKMDYEVGKVPSLYEFLSQQPEDSLIASVIEETDKLPMFTKRSILVGPGYAAPYHQGYYLQIRQRVIDIINAQYSYTPEQIYNFIQKYGIDFWILDTSAFQPDYIVKNRWFNWFNPAPETPLVEAILEAKLKLKQREKLALPQFISSCSVWKKEELIVLSTNCILKTQ